jgi:hypothetical protein
LRKRCAAAHERAQTHGSAGITRRYTVNGGQTQVDVNGNKGIWIGIAVGAAVGIGIAISRRKKSRWDQARELTHRVANRTGDLGDATRDIVDRVKTIYEESRKVVEDAGELWHHGRRLVGAR